MGWEDQGRQYHMWFGHGRAPEKDAEAANPAVVAASAAERAVSLAHGAIASLPAGKRREFERHHREGLLPKLTTMLEALVGAAHAEPATFAQHFFGRREDDSTASSLHQAALAAATATTYADRRDAAGHVAAAMMREGVHEWPGFVARAAARAENVGPSSTSMPQPARRDVILKAADTETVPTRQPTDPVPLVDAAGRPILNMKGTIIPRPQWMTPKFFIDQGLRTRFTVEELLSQGGQYGALAAVGFQTSELARFNRNGPWDAQRIGGKVHKEFVDYATVAIGLFGAASGMTIEDVLRIQNAIAYSSVFAKDDKLDEFYKHLPIRSIRNTKIGYKLFRELSNQDHH